MKIICLLSCLGVVLSACNAGDNSSSSDVQNFSASVSGGYSITGTATDCQNIASNGTCTVVLNPYNATGSTYQGPVGFSPSTGYTSNANTCNNAGSNNQTCTITITNNGTTNATSLAITLNGSVTGASFILAGGN